MYCGMMIPKTTTRHADDQAGPQEGRPAARRGGCRDGAVFRWRQGLGPVGRRARDAGGVELFLAHVARLLPLADCSVADPGPPDGDGPYNGGRQPPVEEPAAVPPITELTRIEPIHLERLAHQGVFTTGLLLEVSETAARRQTLADQVVATTNDVLAWRDEALMLNLAGFGAAEHDLFRYAGFDGLRRSWASTSTRSAPRWRRAAGRLQVEPPSDLMIETWWEQARTLEDE